MRAGFRAGCARPGDARPVACPLLLTLARATTRGTRRRWGCGMRKHLVRLAAMGLVALMGLAPVASTGADSNAVLVNNMLHSTSVLTPLHATDPNRVIGLGIGLQGSNPSGELAFI